MAAEPLPAPAARPQLLSRLIGLPLVLAGGLLVVVVARVWIADRIVTPWILIDEIVYSELAKSVAEDGELLVREVPSDVPSVLYPIAISPAWLIGDGMSTTYGLAKAINVLLMTAVIVPTYLWARRLVPPVWALVAVGLVLVMPSMLYTSVLMTENAFFPLFVGASFAIALALERPTLGHQALALGLVLLAVGVRVQAIVLFVVVPAAIVVKVLLDLRVPEGGPRGGRAIAGLRAFWPTFAALAAGLAAFAVYETAQGRDLSSALGSYNVVATTDYSLGQALHWITLHFAELAFSVGIVPACALLLLLGIAIVDGRAMNAAERAFLAVALTSVVLVGVQVAVFASRFSLRIEERYMFPLAPLLFIALVLWLARGLERPPLLVAIAALVPVVLLLDLRLKELLGVQILSDTFGLIPVWRAAQLLDGGVETAQTLLWVGAALAAAAFAFLPRRLAAAIPLAVAAFLALSSYPVYGAVRDYAESLEAYAGGGDRDWVDDRIGRDADAPYLYDATKTPGYDDMILWQTEFWNRSVGTVVRLGPTVRDPLVEQAAVADPATGRIAAPGIGSPRYAVAANGLTLAGRPVASSSLLTLWQVRPPLRLASAVEGVYGDGWMGSQAAFSQFARTPARHVAVTLSREAWGGKDVPGAVTVRVGPSVAEGSTATIGTVTAERRLVLNRLERRVVRLPAPRAPFRVEVTIAPTFSPARFGLADTRELGAQVRFRVEPAPA